VAGFAAAVVLPARALAGGTGTSTTASSTTGTTATTTTSTTTTTPKKKPPQVPVAKSFPAAGEMLTHSVPVRVAPNPHSHVIRVMHQFRSDFRPQEMFAVKVTTGSDGEPWYRFNKHKWHGPVAIGAPGRETPIGHYFVAARFVPYHDTFLGVFAVETSAYSKLTEWPGGGVVGIHGTSLPQLLGKAVSHGCVRVSNATARKLKSLAPLGTPIWIKK
jgi:lipoprotein-anchoring transpeptidase ErfK/SrfK